MITSIPPASPSPLAPIKKMSSQNDLNVVANNPLPSPAFLQSEIPATAEHAELITSSRREISDIIYGKR